MGIVRWLTTIFLGILIITIAQAQTSWGLPIPEVTTTPGKAKITVSWNSVHPNAHYIVYRNGLNDYQHIVYSGSQAGSFDDTSLINGNPYNYRVFAYIPFQSPSSESAWITAFTNLNAPAHAWIERGPGNSYVAKWQPVAWADEYELQFGTSTPNSTLIITNLTQFPLGTFAPGSANGVIRVFAKNNAGYSASSNWAYMSGGTTQSPIELPPPPFIPSRVTHPFRPHRNDPIHGGLPAEEPGFNPIHLLPFGPLLTGDPVDLATGHNTFNPSPDLSVYNPNGVHAVFKRAYSSALASSTQSSTPGLTSGWSHNYDITLQTINNTDQWEPIILRYPQGAKVVFTPILNAGIPTGEFTSPAGTPLILTGTPGATLNQWTNLSLLHQDRTRWNFSASTNGVHTLASIKNSLGQGISFTYISDQKLSVIRDFASQTTLLQCNYGTNDLIESVSDRYNRRVYFTYESGFASGGLPGVHLAARTQIVDVTTPRASAPIRQRFSYQSGPNGGALLKEIRVISPNQPDRVGTITWATHPILGTPVVSHTTDGNGHINAFTYLTNATKVEVKSNTGTVISHYEQGFDTLLRGTTHKDASGFISVNNFNDPANPHLPSSHFDQVGRLTLYTYDQFGNLTSTTKPNGLTTTNSYDYSVFPVGRLIANTIGTNQVLSYSYFEPSGLIQSITTPNPAISGTVSTNYTYDSLGNLTSVTKPGFTIGTTVTETYNYTTDGTYTQSAAVGQPLTYTNGLGKVQRFRYTVQGLVSQSADALGNTTSNTYNIANQLVSQTLPPASFGANPYVSWNEYAFPGSQIMSSGTTIGAIQIPFLTTLYTYGGEGELLATASGSNSRTSVFDPSYRITASTDAAGRTTTITYNPRGLPHVVTDPLGQSKTFASYSSTGQPTQIIHPGGKVQNLSYHAVTDELLSHTFPSDPAGTTTYTYDSEGRVTSEANPESTISTVYGPAGTIDSQTVTHTGASAKAIQFAYTPNAALASFTTFAGTQSFNYDNAGRVTSLTNPYSETTTYTYLDNNWLNMVTAHNGAKSIYTYDALGRRTLVENRLANNTLISSYSIPSYSTSNNPTSIVSNVPGYAAHTGTVHFQFDSENRISQESGTTVGGFTSNYTHDLAGNPTQFANVTRAYNTVGQRTNPGYTYLANGTPSLHRNITFQSNAQRHITAIGTLTAGYQANGIRSFKRAGTAAKRYYLNIGSSPIIEFNSSNSILAYNTFGPDGLVSRRAGTTSTYYKFNIQGGTAQRLSSTGAVSSRHAYSAYGTPINSSYPTDPWINFKAQYGYYRDWENSILLATHRYYDPEEGTWLATDPIGFHGGPNLYQYCLGNPISYRDPNGQSPQFEYAVASFFQGVGDSFSFGLTRAINEQSGAFSVVDPTSNAYKIGEGTGDLLGYISGKAGIDIGAKVTKNIWGKISQKFLSKASGCFTADTQILLADGTTKPISRLQIGDLIRTRNRLGDEDDPDSVSVVTQLFTLTKPEILTLSLSNGSTLNTTPEHPFYIKTAGFIPAGEIKPGDQIATDSNNFLRVTKTTLKKAPTQVYNFEVLGTHTYFVKAGNQFAWVHNQCREWHHTIPRMIQGMVKGRLDEFDEVISVPWSWHRGKGGLHSGEGFRSPITGEAYGGGAYNGEWMRRLFQLKKDGNFDLDDIRHVYKSMMKDLEWDD
ncbi:hypothetical protein C0431_15135 [bacterium]|nr:hypothetical protein [bacterium]